MPKRERHKIETKMPNQDRKTVPKDKELKSREREESDWNQIGVDSIKELRLKIYNRWNVRRERENRRCYIPERDFFVPTATIKKKNPKFESTQTICEVLGVRKRSGREEEMKMGIYKC